jgi:hypothetical protein
MKHSSRSLSRTDCSAPAPAGGGVKNTGATFEEDGAEAIHFFAFFGVVFLAAGCMERKPLNNQN